MKLLATVVFSVFITLAIVGFGAVASQRAASNAAAAPAAAVTAASQSAAPAPASYTPGFHSSWVGQSAPATIGTGSTAQVTISYRNTGTAAWVKGVPGQQLNLGLNGDGASLAAGWPTPDRLAVQNEDLVKSGEIATFTFGVRAREAKAYRLAVRPVVDGVAWLEDEGAFFTFTGVASSPIDDLLGSVKVINPFALVILAEWAGVLALLYLGRSAFRRLASA